ncbi:hypothetical protein TPHA_0I02280 [Tetrapisispora phaffii CBS 4417]|uniref:Increased recombination centers protein 22 n=1 Tax=Tetrapisispora phaffii (strain ATCC 24235 / CBS 4417 / NBRC 1672 / NRRL Y-8282 / UCD 70-5) TaxID=1071381 RepID=G8BXV4_TETPH|nr:hypothetical protein TPHA_0I02280 [Tetrapisispora phaffii CBS 4417]CCE64732.1 hypothetical protein TPHA_0I02280 [Tetrapisispora phaffii CBS 4417]
MQFFFLLWLAIINNIFVRAETANSTDFDNEISDDVSSNGREFINLNVTYTILEKPNANFTELLEFAPEQGLTLKYNLYNGEDSSVNIVGVSGNVYTYPDGYFAANITESAVDTIVVAFNETTTFQQGVRLALEEGRYFVEPIVIVEKDEQVLRVAVQPVMVEIVPLPLSFFNLEFLSILVALFAIIAGTYYFFIGKSTKVSKSKNAKPIKVDESWLPDNYKN